MEVSLEDGFVAGQSDLAQPYAQVAQNAPISCTGSDGRTLQDLGNAVICRQRDSFVELRVAETL